MLTRGYETPFSGLSQKFGRTCWLPDNVTKRLFAIVALGQSDHAGQRAIDLDIDLRVIENPLGMRGIGNTWERCEYV